MDRFSSIAEVMRSYPDRFYPEKAAHVDGVIQFVFTGEAEQAYSLAIRAGQLAVEPGRHEAPTLTITVPAEEWIRVNNGETNPMGLLMQGRLKVRGSLALAGKFQQMFKPGSELWK